MSTLTAYRVAPQTEFKAAKELRDAGIRAYVPRDPAAKRKAPVAHGYVFSRYKPAFSKHVRSRVGDVSTTDLSRLYAERRRREDKTDAYQVGEVVMIKVGAFANMAGRIERRAKNGWMVATAMFGKQCSVFVKDRYLCRIRDG